MEKYIVCVDCGIDREHGELFECRNGPMCVDCAEKRYAKNEILHLRKEIERLQELIMCVGEGPWWLGYVRVREEAASIRSRL